ncbi:hypothetical protein MSHOH_1445 [Methanosarcina horonobensis HB-1 = JCM 15518]|uniref:Uncharacterized protein n=1 Tax=Methanosarcina horonobensis HB-1 = JCM 15518 TaxID=1434110 RepID=A0A0E3SEJ4_9EURY|nr:hypothetical protein [Methanosarcina horonobensis]AKB77928.1 hypothetical protein MSHOH_1445 [Methanosarcina horonobensis HB-1 = JCM 15518]
MIYPNWIYYPNDELELFIDTVQQVSYVSGCNTTEYVGASDGKLKSKAIRQLPTATFECTWDTNHITDIYRYLDYLKGKQVIIGFGRLDLASWAKITDASFVRTVGTVQKASLSMQFLGDVRGHFWEAEDPRDDGGGAEYSDALASGGKTKRLSGIGSSVSFEVRQSKIMLPTGNYTMFARIKDSNQVTDDLILDVYDRDGSYNPTLTTTATSSFKIYTLNFEISSSEAGHRILFEVFKNKTSTNNIYVDFLSYVAVP